MLNFIKSNWNFAYVPPQTNRQTDRFSHITHLHLFPLSALAEY